MRNILWYLSYHVSQNSFSEILLSFLSDEVIMSWKQKRKKKRIIRRKGHIEAILRKLAS